MSTPNFYKRNARNYYVLDGRTYYNEEGEQLEEWQGGCEVYDDSEDLIDYIREVSGAYANKYACYGRWYVPQKEQESFGYGEWILNVCKKQEIKSISPDCEIIITTEIFLRPGYYEAGNLDWSISVQDNHGCSFDGEYDPEDEEGLVKDCLDYVEYREETWNVGLVKMQSKNIAKKVKEAFEAAQEEADDFCRQNCTGVYGLAYMFSNGEAGYTKIA